MFTKEILIALLALYVVTVVSQRGGRVGRGRGGGGRGGVAGRGEGGGRGGPAGRGRGGGRGGAGRGGEIPLANFNFYSWTVRLDSVTVVEQKALVNSEKNVTTVISAGKDLREANITGSRVIYTESGIVAIKMFGRSSPCFLINVGSSYAEVTDEVDNRNDTEIAVPAQVNTLNATSPPLTREEAAAIFEENTGLARFCGIPRLVQTEITTDAGDDPDTEVKTVLTFDGRVNLVLPKRPVTGGRGRGGNGGIGGRNGRGRGGGGRPNGGGAAGNGGGAGRGRGPGGRRGGRRG